ncbi:TRANSCRIPTION FACTOR MBP1 [Ceraceosorus bombacis]|uniref:TRANSCRIPTION FACTOR MBP1 n=1 Tax=Ceraceosorus bombacis TaxID=401625 RepID=A0A0P1BHL6_9BASI|nr:TRANSCRIPTION FACTOR MBP1 [Ceraceosorus bombacis]
MPAKQEGMIFKATYSGVPVYECLIKGVAVMRRRSDSWMNATHILKVVGLDKPQRTRVLERDVQKNTHEKVQGGYGKYQGTWIPLELAVQLADEYKVAHLLDPITGYQPTAESPPPAPKHVIAPSSRSKKALGEARAGARRATSLESDSEILSGGRAQGTEGTMSPSPSQISSSSRTPSPIAGQSAVPTYYTSQGAGAVRNEGAGGAAAAAAHSMGIDPYVREPSPQSRYAEIILDYFISETTTIPPLLVSPPADFDANMSIDDDEHTALHWACAMGRIRVVKLLLSAGADVFRVNGSGQTALMRAAMFSNNYDLRKFPELFELLHRSILNIDRNDRTVFHHVVDLALSRGKPHAARYYMETMVNRLAEYGSQLADILNFQDDEGETPLTMAARARSKRIVRLLLEHGSDPKIRNKDGKSAEDYIVEDERFRASPPRGAGYGGLLGEGTATNAALHTSEAGQRAGGRATQLMQSLLGNLADSYDSELNSVEKKLAQAHALLAQIQAEIAESARQEAAKQAVGGPGGDATSEATADGVKGLANAELALTRGVEKRSREQMVREWAEVEDSVKRVRTERNLPDGALLSTSNGEASSATVESLLAPAPGGDTSAAIASLRQKVTDLKTKRSEVVKKFVEHAREQGAGKQALAYRRLIAAGFEGNIGAEEVDHVVSALVELLEDNNKAGSSGVGGEGALAPDANAKTSGANGSANANGNGDQGAAALLKSVRAG